MGRVIFVGLIALQGVIAGCAIAAPVIEWPADGPLVRLGPNYPHQPLSSYVFAPEAVAQAARKTVGGNPATWRVEHLEDTLRVRREEYGTNEQYETVVIQNQFGKRAFACLIQKDRWKRLNTPQSLPYINEVLGARVKLPRDQHASVRVSEFVQDVASFYKPKVGLNVLLKSYLLDPKEYIHGISGPDKDAKDFRSLCMDPVVTFDRGIWTVVVNAVTINEGAVQTWMLTLRTGKRTEVTGIQMHEIRPPGSFYDYRY